MREGKLPALTSTKKKKDSDNKDKKLCNLRPKTNTKLYNNHVLFGVFFKNLSEVNTKNKLK